MNKIFLQVCLFIFLSASCYGCAKEAAMDLRVPQQRAKVVDVYLADFCAPSFMKSKIGPAIRDVMMRLPVNALEIMMDRRRPVLFVDVLSSGMGGLASSSEVIMTEKDAPAFQQGMTLIKISDALGDGASEAVAGIVAHEIAHRVLDHIRKDHVSCRSERETNRLIKSWGFTKEFEAASKEFGHAKLGEGSSPCQDDPVAKE